MMAFNLGLFTKKGEISVVLLYIVENFNIITDDSMEDFSAKAGWSVI